MCLCQGPPNGITLGRVKGTWNVKPEDKKVREEKIAVFQCVKDCVMEDTVTFSVFS